MWFIVLLSKKYRQILCDFIAFTSIEAVCRVSHHAKYPVCYIRDFISAVSGRYSETSNIDVLISEACTLIRQYQLNCDLVQLIRVAEYLLHNTYFMKSDS